MIDIIDKRKCTGCGACVSRCAKEAICLIEDQEGFRYPQIDRNRCIDCGLCEKVCPMLDSRHGIPDDNVDYSAHFYAGQLIDKTELGNVSSGGAFWALALTVFDHGGVVYGAVQENIDQIRHIRVESKEAAYNIRKSKYFQSDVSGVYEQVIKDLELGRSVLFSGTPCQIAALNRMANKSYDSLYTCEVICHGVPSMAVWRKYRQETEEKRNKHISGLVFRDKTRGWRKNHYRISFDDGSEVLKRSNSHIFHSGYLVGLFTRPSCSVCPFSQMPRCADISLADYWKYDGDFFGNNENMGISLITVNNDKGEQLISESRKYMDMEDTSEARALSSCRHLSMHLQESPYRSRFFDKMNRCGFYAAAYKYLLKAKLYYIVTQKIHKPGASVFCLSTYRSK